MDREKEIEPLADSLSIAFLGDISLNDSYVECYKQGINPFKEIGPELKKADYVIGNLECMAKGAEGENLLKNPRLTTTSETLNYLKEIHLSAVTLAHNHVYDHLTDGFLKTTRKLDKLGIKYLGAGVEKEIVSEPLILSKKGIKIGFLNYVTHDTNPNLPDDADVYLNYFDRERARNDIETLKPKVDHVVVLLHWGGTVENGYFPDMEQPEIARSLIEYGADLIIGHHSHTFQPYEEIMGKKVFYSLGNFCFADIRFEDKIIEIQEGKNTEAAIVEVKFFYDRYQTNVRSIRLVDGSPKEEPELLKSFLDRNHTFQRIKHKPVILKICFWKLKKIDPVIFYFFGNNRNPIKQLFSLDIKKAANYLGFWKN